MNPFNPDAYCGIYCGACSIAMHGATGRGPTASPLVSGPCPGRISSAAAANPTRCLPVAASAPSAAAPARRHSRTASIAPITPAGCTATGNRRPGSSPTPVRPYPTWRRLNATASIPGLRRRKSDGPARTAARPSPGMRRSAASAAANSHPLRTAYRAGGESCAVSSCPWRTGRGRGRWVERKKIFSRGGHVFNITLPHRTIFPHPEAALIICAADKNIGEDGNCSLAKVCSQTNAHCFLNKVYCYLYIHLFQRIIMI